MGDMSDVKRSVHEHYRKAALKVLDGGGGCCGADDPCGQLSEGLYSAAESAAVPQAAVRASFGCGNPVALAELHEGDVVLDLGSGGGVDVLLSARRVGASGHVYGLDMTDEMLELARVNLREAGADNVEFLKGEMEDVPLPDATVDVIISNCVVNLSADKDRVFAEAHRVLSPGGRIAVSDVVARQELAADVRANPALWSACLGGALREEEYRAGLERAGFVDVRFESTREYSLPGIGNFASVFVRASRP
jgi:ubiquinone/menaquinone biosynthesis C-methylase UbiE